MAPLCPGVRPLAVHLLTETQAASHLAVCDAAAVNVRMGMSFECSVWVSPDKHPEVELLSLLLSQFKVSFV